MPTLPAKTALLRRIFTRKTLVRLVFAGALIVTLLVATIAVVNWRGERDWAAYRADAEKRGARLQLADFVAPVVPDAENFAAIPVIQDVFAASNAGKEPPNPLVFPMGDKVQPPKLASRQTGERLDLAQWRDFFKKTQLLQQTTDNAARDVLTAIGHYEPALQQFHEAAQRPHARFPVKWELNISAQLPHITILRSAARLDALKMGAHLALGDSAAAYADWRDGLGICRALEHEPVLITGLIRLATLNVLVEGGVWDGLAGRQWAEPELRAIAADLAGLDLLADLHFAVASERGAMNDTIEWFRNLSSRERRNVFYTEGGPTADTRPLAWLYPTGWFRENQVKMNGLYDRRLAQIDPAHGRFNPDAASDEEIMGLRGAGPFTRYQYALAALLMPALDNVEIKFALSYTTMQEARVACALELFRRAHGAFPERLDELVPGVLDAVPRDVMDGAPLRYRRTSEGGFELWGAGWNRIDDGGKSAPGKSPREQPDWVWHS